MTRLHDVVGRSDQIAAPDFWALFTLAAGATRADQPVLDTIAEVVNRIGGLAGRRVAELGSGSGRCAAAIATHRPAELIAVEQSAVLAAMSRDMYPQVRVVIDDYANLAALGAFDIVFALAHLVFIHGSIDQLVTGLRNIRAAMPDDGVLIVEQFELTDQPRSYCGDGMQVQESTHVVDTHRMRHSFVISRGSNLVATQEFTSLRLRPAEVDQCARKAGFEVDTHWDQRAPTGEMSRMYLLRAVGGFNYLSDLPDFLESWLDAGHPRNQEAQALIVDDRGRARPEGVLAAGQGASLSRHHTAFQDSLEPAIRPLVVELVTGWNFVTYSSCDGHLQDDGRYTEAYCGVVTFGDKHERAVSDLLARYTADWNGHSVEPRLRHRPLLGPSTPQRAVDLLIAGTAPTEWLQYQRERDRLIAHLCTRLRAERLHDRE